MTVFDCNDELVYNNRQLNILFNVRRNIIENPEKFDSYWNHSDNIGLVIQEITKLSGQQLKVILYNENPEYVQCNWKKVFAKYNLGELDEEVFSVIFQLFSEFNYSQLMEIMYASSIGEEYKSFISFLRGKIINQLDRLLILSK